MSSNYLGLRVLLTLPKRVPHALLLSTLLTYACSVTSSPRESAKDIIRRQPLEKTPHEYKTPTKYEARIKGYNVKTGETITYDQKPRVQVIDAKRGKYSFKWIGFDGRQKTATFQSSDAVDVM